MSYLLADIQQLHSLNDLNSIKSLKLLLPTTNRPKLISAIIYGYKHNHLQ